jgi:23S rRNA (adenine-N6)-dimethyltransferase
VPSLSHRTASDRTNGYHRIRDARIAERIVASTGLAPPDLVVEFGAGDGQLSAAVATRSRKLLCVELDRERWSQLKRRFAEDASVEPILADFMAFQLPGRSPYKLISNVPFGLTARLLRRLLEIPNAPAAAYLIIQAEAAQKWAGIGHETSASVVLKSRFEARTLLPIHRTAFEPRPDADAVLVELRLRARPLVHGRHLAQFERFVRQSFGMAPRRKSPPPAAIPAATWAARFYGRPSRASVRE